jgi:hypothetical protein
MNGPLPSRTSCETTADDDDVIVQQAGPEYVSLIIEQYCFHGKKTLQYSIFGIEYHYQQLNTYILTREDGPHLFKLIQGEELIESRLIAALRLRCIYYYH